MKPVLQNHAALRSSLAVMLIVLGNASSAQGNENADALPEVSGAWVKTTVPGSSVSAAYLQIKSRTSLKLVKVASPVAAIVEIHDMKMNGGVMEMKAMDAVDVPAGKVIELKPGGLHIMLMQVKKPINKGDKVPLTLTFEASGKRPMMMKLDAIAREHDAHRNKH